MKRDRTQGQERHVRPSAVILQGPASWRARTAFCLMSTPRPLRWRGQGLFFTPLSWLFCVIGALVATVSFALWCVGLGMLLIGSIVSDLARSFRWPRAAAPATH